MTDPREPEIDLALTTTPARYRLIVRTMMRALSAEAGSPGERQIAQALHDLLGRPDLSGAER